MWFIKEYLLGYLLFSVAVVGYFGYYLPDQSASMWHWVIICIIGLFLLVYKNSKKVPDNKKSKVILFDVLYIILIPLIASIPLPRGLAILLACVIAVFLPFFIVQYAFKPFGNNDRS